MTIPGRVVGGLEAVVGPLEAVVGPGGDERRGACRIRAGGEDVFLKYDLSAAPDFFAVEAAGLEAIDRASPGIRVPRVLGVERGEAGWIAIEWLPAVPPGTGFGRALGEGLATLHRTMAPAWGWDREGFIGTLPQSNGWMDDWAEFWWSRRLSPQLDRARAAGHPVDDGWAELRSRLPTLLRAAVDDGPSLLHGDLWNGNALSVREGPALIDPSCYFGHREVDLAMTELFGGFDPEFRAAYEGEWPLLPDYPIRRSIYQLYYLLVHLNLFGASYLDRTLATLRTALAA